MIARIVPAESRAGVYVYFRRSREPGRWGGSPRYFELCTDAIAYLRTAGYRPRRFETEPGVVWHRLPGRGSTHGYRSPGGQD